MTAGLVFFFTRPSPVPEVDYSAPDDRVGELRRFEGHTDVIVSVAFSPDGRLALSAASGTDKSLRLWDVETGREVRRFEGHKGAVHSVAFSPDGRRILSAAGGTVIVGDNMTLLPEESLIRVWDAESGQEAGRIPGHDRDVQALTLSPDGRRALSGSWDTTARVWDIESGRELRRFEKHAGSVFSVAFAPDGLCVLSGSIDGAIWLWYAESGREIRRFEGHQECVTGLAFSPDARRAASASTDKTVRLWDVESGKELRRFEAPTTWVNSLAFSPDGRRLVSGTGGIYENGKIFETDDNSLYLWDADTGKLIQRFSGHTRRVASVAFSPDGHRALSGSWDKTVRLWGLPK